MFGFGNNKKPSENSSFMKKFLTRLGVYSSRSRAISKDIQQASVGIIFVLVTDDQYELYNDALSKIISITIENQGTIMEVAGSLVLIGFNLPCEDHVEQDNAGQLRSNTVNMLLSELNESVRIVHGELEVAVGAFGNQQLSSYTAFIPGFDKYLLKLSSLENGEQLNIG